MGVRNLISNLTVAKKDKDIQFIIEQLCPMVLQRFIHAKLRYS